MRAKANAQYVRYPFPKSLSPGKGLTLGHSASKAVVSLAKLESCHLIAFKTQR